MYTTTEIKIHKTISCLYRCLKLLG